MFSQYSFHLIQEPCSSYYNTVEYAKDYLLFKILADEDIKDSVIKFW